MPEELVKPYQKQFHGTMKRSVNLSVIAAVVLKAYFSLK